MRYLIKSPTAAGYVSLLILLIFLLTTNPDTLPAWLLLVPAVLILSGSYFLSLGLGIKLLPGRRFATHRLMAIIVSFVTTILFVLQSLSQLALGDGLLLGLLALLFVIYIYRLQS